VCKHKKQLAKVEKIRNQCSIGPHEQQEHQQPQGRHKQQGLHVGSQHHNKNIGKDRADTSSRENKIFRDVNISRTPGTEVLPATVKIPAIVQVAVVMPATAGMPATVGTLENNSYCILYQELHG
jgi:hypothetical protein